MSTDGMSADDPTAIAAVPALPIERGFRLLVMRALALDDGPPAYAVIGQSLVRAPPRSIRHGVAFALAFGPQVMAWLSEALGRPAWRDASGAIARNPRWPGLAWHCAARKWPDGSVTTEWSADILFPEADDRAAFALAFAAPLAGLEAVSDTV